MATPHCAAGAGKRPGAAPISYPVSGPGSMWCFSYSRMARPSGAKDHGHVAPGLERKAVESGDHRDVGGARGLAEHLLDGVRIGWRNAHEFLRPDDDLRAFGRPARDAIRVGVP